MPSNTLPRARPIAWRGVHTGRRHGFNLSTTAHPAKTYSFHYKRVVLRAWQTIHWLKYVQLRGDLRVVSGHREHLLPRLELLVAGLELFVTVLQAIELTLSYGHRWSFG